MHRELGLRALVDVGGDGLPEEVAARHAEGEALYQFAGDARHGADQVGAWEEILEGNEVGFEFGFDGVSYPSIPSGFSPPPPPTWRVR